MSRLEGTVAIVTGGGGGIGRAVSLRLTSDGGTVVVAERDEDAGVATVRGIREAGGQALVVRTDVTDRGEVDRLVADTLTRFAKIDVLVNCAAITRRYERFLEIVPEEWRRMIDVNLTGAFHCSQAVARHMAERKRGRIINIGSVGSFMPERHAAHYCASKGGLEMLTKAMAVDLSPYNILVNAVHPGAIRVNGDPDSEQHGTDPDKIPLGRFGHPEEIAAAVAFIASGEATYFQGASIVIDGGYLLT